MTVIVKKFTFLDGLCFFVNAQMGKAMSDSQSTAHNVSSALLSTDKSSSSSSGNNKRSSLNTSHKCLQTSAVSSSEATTAAVETQFSEDSLAGNARSKQPVLKKVDGPAGTNEKAAILVCYPNYALPDLSFLGPSAKMYDANVYLCPQKANGSPDTSVVNPAKLPAQVRLTFKPSFLHSPVTH